VRVFGTCGGAPRIEAKGERIEGPLAHHHHEVRELIELREIAAHVIELSSMQFFAEPGNARWQRLARISPDFVP
jgi:hypothetical protein